MAHSVSRTQYSLGSGVQGHSYSRTTLRAGRIEIASAEVRGQKPLAIDSYVDEAAKFTRCHFLFALNADDHESSACTAALPDAASPVRAEALLGDGVVFSLLREIRERLPTFTHFGIMWHHIKSYARRSQRPGSNHTHPA
jgi:hypothetical protein